MKQTEKLQKYILSIVLLFLSMGIYSQDSIRIVKKLQYKDCTFLMKYRELLWINILEKGEQTMDFSRYQDKELTDCAFAQYIYDMEKNGEFDKLRDGIIQRMSLKTRKKILNKVGRLSFDLGVSPQGSIGTVQLVFPARRDKHYKDKWSVLSAIFSRKELYNINKYIREFRFTPLSEKKLKEALPPFFSLYFPVFAHDAEENNKFMLKSTQLLKDKKFKVDKQEQQYVIKKRNNFINIHPNLGKSEPHKYTATTKTITLTVYSAELLSRALNHAYQDELGILTEENKSNNEFQEHILGDLFILIKNLPGTYKTSKSSQYDNWLKSISNDGYGPFDQQRFLNEYQNYIREFQNRYNYVPEYSKPLNENYNWNWEKMFQFNDIK